MANKIYVGQEGVQELYRRAKALIPTVDEHYAPDSSNAQSGIGVSEAVASYSNHVANGDIHVTAAQKSTWSGKQDKLTPGAGISIDSNNVISYTGGSDDTWAHFSNTSLWTTAYNNSADHRLSANLGLAEGELIPNIDSVLPAGLYDFKIELAFKTIAGYEADVMQRTEMQIKYGSDVLRSETFTFDGTSPESNEQTAWSGGLFKLPSDGGIKVVAKMRNVDDPAGFRAKLKLSHLFIRKVG